MHQSEFTTTISLILYLRLRILIHYAVCCILVPRHTNAIPLETPNIKRRSRGNTFLSPVVVIMSCTLDMSPCLHARTHQ